MLGESIEDKSGAGDGKKLKYANLSYLLYLYSSNLQMRIAINGMGRIGRLLFRRLIDHPIIELVAVNDIMNADNLIYLLQYDSVYGNSNHSIDFQGKLNVKGKSVDYFRETNPLQHRWKELGIDIVLECTGKFTSYKLAAQHLQAGARKVLLSTTGASDIPLLIYGYNHNELENHHDIISPGGCMTNCSTHLISLMNQIGIDSLQIQIIHSYTSRQTLVDSPHNDLRRGRAANESIIPVEIDLADSLTRLFPELNNKIAATSTRVPVANGAMADFTFQLQRELKAENINQIIREATLSNYKTILEYTESPIVSTDVKGSTYSAIVEGSLTKIVERQAKLIAFFDNEYGYTSRIIDWLIYWQRFL